MSIIFRTNELIIDEMNMLTVDVILFGSAKNVYLHAYNVFLLVF